MERADLIVSEVNRQHEIVIRQIGRAEPRPRASAHGGATRQRWRTLLTCFAWQLVCPENTITYLAQGRSVARRVRKKCIRTARSRRQGKHSKKKLKINRQYKG